MPRRLLSRRWRWIVGILILLVIAVAISVRLMITHAEPILRARVIDTLSARFKSRVELDELQVWVADGLHVEGKGLKIYGAKDPNSWAPGVQPLLDVPEFRFQTALRSLFRDPMRVDTIYVDGMVLNIPPNTQHEEIKELKREGRKFKISIAVDHFVCAHTLLVINSSKPEKPPLKFEIGDLRMKDIGPGLPLQFDATLINPKPRGAIQSTGQFGPLNEKRPRDTAVEGNYSFTKVDLATLPGIAGILSSTGRYGGTLGRIEVEGRTETPDFRLAVSGHPVPLHTDFHAVVDGTDGDTYLDPVKVKLLHSSFTASGKVVRVKSPEHGHDVELHVVIGDARVEDFLQLGIRTEPPVMTGPVAMKAKFSLPAGAGDFSRRLELAGTFHIPEAHFTSEKLQGEIDSLSMRSQGVHNLPKEVGQPVVTSDLNGVFTLSEGELSFSQLHFSVPGTQAEMTGRYSLDGQTFDFHGTLRLDAKLSDLTTGWKSILLKPVDPFFEKHGAGTELPFKIGGTRQAPQFGLDFHRKNDHSKPDHVTESRRQAGAQ